MKPKVIVLVPVHCAPKVAMMTLGSWLEDSDGSYEAEVILGVHENYHHYHNGLNDLSSLPVTVSKVRELNWHGGTPKDALVRYSRMHALNIKAMMEVASTKTFDHLAILDHDLVFNTDFIGYSMKTGEDLIGCYMDDRQHSIKHDTCVGALNFAPKFSVWHLVMSNKYYRNMMSDIEMIFPDIRDGWFYDTFSRVIPKIQLPVKVMKQAEIGEMVRHRWSLSFNFGPLVLGNEYARRLAEAESEFDQRFPSGIETLFQKVRA